VVGIPQGLMGVLFSCVCGRFTVAPWEETTLRAVCELLVGLKLAPGSDFAPSLRDCDPISDAYPGLRCACPGLLSILPPGEKRYGFITQLLIRP